MGRNHRLKVTGIHQFPVPFPLRSWPGIRLRRTRNRSLYRYIRMKIPQRQDTFTEIQIAPLGHATDKMTVSLIISQFHRILHPLFQGKTPRVFLIVPPWQFSRPMPRKTAALLSCAHAIPSFSAIYLYFHSIEHLFFCVNKNLHIPTKIYCCKSLFCIVYYK